MRAEIRAEAERCAREIQSLCPEARVIVFGSAINEKVRAPRDIDLLVIIPKSDSFERMRRRILAISRTSWPLDIIVVPSDFFDEKISQSGNFYAFIYEEGVELGQKQKVSA